MMRPQYNAWEIAWNYLLLSGRIENSLHSAARLNSILERLSKERKMPAILLANKAITEYEKDTPEMYRAVG